MLILGINLTKGLASMYVLRRCLPETVPSCGSVGWSCYIREKVFFFVFSASFLRVHIPSDLETMFKGRSRQKPGHGITQKHSVVSGQPVLSLVVNRNRYLVHRNYSSALVLLSLYKYHSTPGTETTRTSLTRV